MVKKFPKLLVIIYKKLGYDFLVMNFEILRATALIFRERQKNMAAEGATQLSDSVHLVKSIVKTEAEAEKAFVFCIG